MQFLEKEGLDHIKGKTALKTLAGFITSYINMDVPEFNSTYIGKITSSDFSTLKNSFYEAMDSYGMGELENVRYSLSLIKD